MRLKVALIAICVAAASVNAIKSDDLGENLAALGIKPDQIFAEAKGNKFKINDSRTLEARKLCAQLLHSSASSFNSLIGVSCQGFRNGLSIFVVGSTKSQSFSMN